MSTDERTYMLATGKPLTDYERRIALEMRHELAQRIANNISKLEAELRILRGSHDVQLSRIASLARDWKELGPNTTLHISGTERGYILNGMPTFGIEIHYTAPDKVLPSSVPDETEAFRNPATSGR